MSDLSDERMFYKYQALACNAPDRFLQDQNMYLRHNPKHRAVIQLNCVNALIVTGHYQKALNELDKLLPAMEAEKDSFAMCQCHIQRYRVYSLSEIMTAKANDELAQAVRLQKKSGSKSQEVELGLINCFRQMSETETTSSEELLHSLMDSALESANPDLVLDIYLGFIQVYMSNNIPDMANRELLLLKEMISKDKNPLKYATMLNFHGIINDQMGLNSEAEAIFREGIDLARTNNYYYAQVQMLMNLGINCVRQKNYSQGIANYEECMILLADNRDLQLELANKVLVNTARAMSVNGQLRESIELMRQAIDTAKNLGNERTLNILRVNLADALIEIGEYPNALELIDCATEYFANNKLYDYLQNCHLCKARLWEVQEDYQSAFNSMEVLYTSSRMYFQENFIKQTRRYQQRINELRNEYFQVKSRCECFERLSLHDKAQELIGNHPQVKKAVSNAIQAAKYPFVHVLITGESGTGKEIIAGMIHQASHTGKPMVAINASAISPNLIESELFGHVKGAFTGAITDHKGKFVLANNSTLFLDEISDMPLECQVKVLRAIEHQSITPVGSDKEIPVRCRIISATNRSITDLIRANKFRLDLFHRLNKVEIYLPPLRDRLSDLELLTEHFIKRFSREFGLVLPRIESSFHELLKEYSFPGNIRELMNIIERIFILKPKPVWDAGQLEGLLTEKVTPPSDKGSIQTNLQQTEYQMILNALQEVNWVQKNAAAMLGMTESTLSRHIKRLGIKR